MDSYVDELGHDYNATVVDSTCIMEGYTEQKCSRCDSNYKDNFVPTKPHVYNNGAYCVNCGSNNPEAIRIIYVLNGAENDPRNLEYFMKGSANTLYDPLSREGYEFRGWYLDEDCTIRVTSLYDITEDVTLYSKWVKVYNGNYNDGVETPDVPF